MSRMDHCNEVMKTMFKILPNNCANENVTPVATKSIQPNNGCIIYAAFTVKNVKRASAAPPDTMQKQKHKFKNWTMLWFILPRYKSINI